VIPPMAAAHREQRIRSVNARTVGRGLACGLIPTVMIGLLLGVTSGSAARAPQSDYLLVFPQRAGPYRFADSFQEGKPHAYQAAVGAFGKPTELRGKVWEGWPEDLGGKAGECVISWANAGVRVRLVSVSGRGQDRMARFQPCSGSALAQADFDSVRLFGPKWRNRTGARIGAPPPPRSGRPGIGIRVNVPAGGWTDYGAPWGKSVTLAEWAEVDSSGSVTSIDVALVSSMY